MPRVITTLQAMSHPDVVATINCLSEMSQRLQDENDELKAALAQPDAFEQGRQEGMKQERALWELSKLGQEIEAQPEQEPVARVIDDGSPEGATEWIPFAKRVEPLKTGDLLYTAQPQRPWGPLTDEDIYDMYNEPRSDAEMVAFAREVEAKLKAMNT